MGNEIILSGSNQAIINSDTTKIFVWKNRYNSATYTNDTGETVTLASGTLLGRISATGEVYPLDSAAVDGSEYPVGVLLEDVTVLDTESATLTYCVSGDVVESKIIFLGYGDDISTVVDGKQLRDRIASDTVGINLVSSTELSAYDNQ